MKKLFSFHIIAWALITLFLSSCSYSLDPEDEQVTSSKPLVFSASVEQSGTNTKTAINSETLEVNWVSGDCLSIFAADGTNNKFSTNDSGASASFTGTFSGTMPETYYAIYPYNANASFDPTSNVITTTLANNQTATAGTPAPGLMLSAAFSSTTKLAFKNIISIYRFKVDRDDITSVKLQGNNGEIIAGTIQVSWANDEPVATVVDGKKSIMLEPEEGCFEKGQWYYFALIPQTFTDGITIKVWSSDGKHGFKKVSSSLQFSRAESKKTENLTGTMPFVVDAFSVSDTKQIVFAPGNLQYQASTHTWRFAEHTYDMIGKTAGNTTSNILDNKIRSTQESWIDLFGWGTNGYNYRRSSDWYFVPYIASPSTTTAENAKFGPIYTSGGGTENDLVGDNESHTPSDWGYQMRNYMGGGWRTPTKEEWVYLLGRNEELVCNTRIHVKEQFQSISVLGLVILPDDYNDPLSLADISSGGLSVDEWLYLTKEGAVFLPLAGSCTLVSDNIPTINTSVSYYWSSTARNSYSAYSLKITTSSSNYLNASYATNRSYLGAVRLIRDI